MNIRLLCCVIIRLGTVNLIASCEVIDILVQKRKDTKAAKRFFKKLLKKQGEVPYELMTDKLKSYAAVKKELMPSVTHIQDRYANNRAENSHQRTRQQERQMKGFKSHKQAQTFLSIHGQINNLFNLGRHLMCAKITECFVNEH